MPPIATTGTPSACAQPAAARRRRDARLGLTVDEEKAAERDVVGACGDRCSRARARIVVARNADRAASGPTQFARARRSTHRRRPDVHAVGIDGRGKRCVVVDDEDGAARRVQSRKRSRLLRGASAPEADLVAILDRGGAAARAPRVTRRRGAVGVVEVGRQRIEPAKPRRPRAAALHVPSVAAARIGDARRSSASAARVGLLARPEQSIRAGHWPMPGRYASASVCQV